MSAPIDLYFWPTPNGLKITIALEEMKLPYRVRPVNIGKGEQFAPEFLKISPNNRMPAIVDPEGPGGAPISIFESGAILQYLGRKSGLLYPRDERARSEVEQWLYWQVGGLGPMSGQAAHFKNYAKALVTDVSQLDYGRERYAKEVNRLYGVMDRRLADRDYLAGDYSIADIASWPWVKIAASLDQSLDDFPALKAWFARVGAREAVRVGSQVGKDLGKNLAQQSAEEMAESAKHLFGQTAGSVTDRGGKS